MTRLREASGLEVTPQDVAEHASPRAAAAQLLALARAADGGGGGGAPPAHRAEGAAVPLQSALGAPQASDAELVPPPAAVPLDASRGRLAAPAPASPPAEWRLPAALWEWGRGSGLSPFDPYRLRASGAVCGPARRGGAPLLFYVPGLPGVCCAEFYRAPHLS